MVPSLNFNPSFANLAALRNLRGLPHPVGGPISRPIVQGSPMPMPGAAPGMPAQAPMPMQAPQGNLANLRALMQMFGRQPSQA